MDLIILSLCLFALTAVCNPLHTAQRYAPTFACLALPLLPLRIMSPNIPITDFLFMNFFVPFYPITYHTLTLVGITTAVRARARGLRHNEGGEGGVHGAARGQCRHDGDGGPEAERRKPVEAKGRVVVGMQTVVQAQVRAQAQALLLLPAAAAAGQDGRSRAPNPRQG